MIILKKRKTYEISVIDKTYSKIISDETKFYTSDTALELAFELKETEYNFESAEIVLLNVDDRSLATRPVSKVNNDFVYEIDDDITSHYGDWRGQLMLVEKGEVHVSSPIKFRIENDLYCNKPLEITEVVSWVSLKQYANGLIDELKQAVLSAEGIEDTFNENELERQNQFETAEQSRQTTFEMAESERDRTFESNETTRQAQELEREKAETTRQTVFDGNEAGRTETFNANEATRQENETTRQLAESQRQSTFETNETERQTTFETAELTREQAEIQRATAEEQRKVDHANRSAELAGKADKKQEAWITPTLLSGATSKEGFPVGYMKDEMGFVHFRGRLILPSYGTRVLTLPVGYRPSSSIDFLCHVEPNKFGRVSVQWAGAVYPLFPYNADSEYDLSHITFKADK